MTCFNMNYFDLFQLSNIFVTKDNDIRLGKNDNQVHHSILLAFMLSMNQTCLFFLHR